LHDGAIKPILGERSTYVGKIGLASIRKLQQITARKV
jgi:hypothetical protein